MEKNLSSRGLDISLDVDDGHKGNMSRTSLPKILVDSSNYHLWLQAVSASWPKQPTVSAVKSPPVSPASVSSISPLQLNKEAATHTVGYCPHHARYEENADDPTRTKYATAYFRALGGVVLLLHYYVQPTAPVTASCVRHSLVIVEKGKWGVEPSIRLLINLVLSTGPLATEKTTDRSTFHRLDA